MTEQVAVKGQQPAEEKKEKTKKEMTRFQWTWHEMKRQKVGYYMVIPFLIMFICFYGHPCPAFDSAQLYFL